MKLAVVGSRTFNDYEFLKKMLAFHPCDQIISGGAKGADTLAIRYAIEMGINYKEKEFLPNYKLHSRRAPLVRNQKIADACDELVAFWNGESRGTGHVVWLAKRAGKPVYTYWPQPLDILEGIGI